MLGMDDKTMRTCGHPDVQRVNGTLFCAVCSAPCDSGGEFFRPQVPSTFGQNQGGGGSGVVVKSIKSEGNMELPPQESVFVSNQGSDSFVYNDSDVREDISSSNLGTAIRNAISIPNHQRRTSSTNPNFCFNCGIGIVANIAVNYCQKCGANITNTPPLRPHPPLGEVVNQHSPPLDILPNLQQQHSRHPSTSPTAQGFFPDSYNSSHQLHQQMSPLIPSSQPESFSNIQNAAFPIPNESGNQQFSPTALGNVQYPHNSMVPSQPVIQQIPQQNTLGNSQFPPYPDNSNTAEEHCSFYQNLGVSTPQPNSLSLSDILEAQDEMLSEQNKIQGQQNMHQSQGYGGDVHMYQQQQQQQQQQFILDMGAPNQNTFEMYLGGGNDRMDLDPGNVEHENHSVETDEYKDTVLHQYIQQDNAEKALEELQRLTQTYDPNTVQRYINKRNEQGKIALHSAVQYCRDFRVIDALLDTMSDISILDHQGNNILHQTVLKSANERDVLMLFEVIFKYQPVMDFNALLNDRVRALNSDGFAVVHMLTKQGYADALRYLHGRGANLNITDRKEKQTPLVLASKSRMWAIVDVLCSLKACVNIPTSSEWYPVHAAIEDKSVERLEFFMKGGVDIYGYTKIQTTEQIVKMCDTYMRKRRRKTSTKDRGTKKRTRCKCGSEDSVIR